MNKFRHHAGLYAIVGIMLLVSGFFPYLAHFDATTTNVRAAPPAGYNHRPLDEFFTSLTCGPCVNSADPVQDEVWEDWGHDTAVRYNWVVFHTYAPSADDLSTPDGGDRQADYTTISTNPTIIYDGGYYRGGSGENVEDTKGYIDDCGTRDVERDVEVFIEQEYVANGIEFHYQIHYLGGEGNTPDGTPTVDDIDASVYIFVVEDNIIAYSSVIDDDYLCHNVFREYAKEDESFTMVEGDWHNSSVIWEWPSTEPTIPIQPHEVQGIIAVFDEEDTNSGNEPTITMPRLSNSANYKSTIWDWEEEAPSINNVQANHNEFDLTISADLTDPDGISSAWLVYNFTDVAYDWSILEMNVDAGNKASATITGAEGNIVNYMILAFDSNHLQSQTQLEQHSFPNYPPAQITDLVATPGSVEGTVDLTWTAPGSDDNEGTASEYHIKYLTDSITEANWDAAVNVTSPPTPQIAGSTEEFTVEGLTPDQTYYFAIRAEDDVGNIASVSNSPSAVAPSNPSDVTPPGKINDLMAEQSENEGEVILTWTAPGDDGYSGTALKYYIRYSQDKISTEDDWDSASVVSNPPTPKVAGSHESHTIKYLNPDDILYFAIRAEDDMELVGSISNSPSVTVPGADTTPPAKITDLAASPGDNEGEVTLTWTAPGDDGNSGGKAEEYIIKYSLSDITDENDFNDATGVAGEPTPKNPGETETFTVTDLTPDIRYYFAIVTEDEVPNPSAISNSAYAVATGIGQGIIQITDISYTPTNPTVDDEVTISATVIGENTIDSVWVEYCLGEMCFAPVTMVASGIGKYSVDLGQLEAGDYHYTVKAKDDLGNEVESNEFSFTVSEGTTDGDGTTKEGEIPWYESETGIYLIAFLIVIIAIILILATVLSRSKKEAAAEPQPTLITEETPAEPVFTPMVAPQQEEISCPKCSTVFSIPLEPRPMEVQCPSCNTKGIID